MKRSRGLLRLTQLIRTRRLTAPRGQIVTFLLLIVVAILIFVMVTANLGQLSLKSTQLANAADAASLLLASQLATISSAYAHNLGDATEKCWNAGPLITVLSAVLAVAGFFVCGPPCAVAGGVIGGALGGGIMFDWTIEGILKGALHGLMIGFAVAMLATAVQNLLSAAGPGSTIEAGQAVTGGDIGATLQTAGGGVMSVLPHVTTTLPVTGTIVAGSVTAVSTVATLVGGAAALGSTIINPPGGQLQQWPGDQALEVIKRISSLPVYLSLQQTVLFQALSRAVEDPTTVPDTHDINGNGFTTEPVSRFLDCWDQHVIRLNTDYQRSLPDFINTVVAPFTNYVKSTYCPSGTLLDGVLKRQEIEGSDGLLVEVARALYPNVATRLSFWEPGPSAVSGFSSCADDTFTSSCVFGSSPTSYPCCNFTCPGDCATACASQQLCHRACPTGDSTCETQQCTQTCSNWDSVDTVNEQFRGFVRQANPLIAKASSLGSEWAHWKSWFYVWGDDDQDCHDESTDHDCLDSQVNDYFDVFGVVLKRDPNRHDRTGDDDPHFQDFKSIDNGVDSVTGWRAELQTRKGSLPLCNATTNPTNYPCRWADGSATIDADADDEFAQVDEKLNLLSQLIQGFRHQTCDYVNNKLPSGYEQEGRVTYNWTDTAGNHSVGAEVGPFQIASIGHDERGGFFSFLIHKECAVLQNYNDDSGARTWVEVSRQDPANVDVTGKRLWLWNPFSSGQANVTKLSCAKYNYNDVALAGTAPVGGCRQQTVNPSGRDLCTGGTSSRTPAACPAPSCPARPSGPCLPGTCNSYSDCTGQYAGQLCTGTPNPLLACPYTCQCKPSGAGMGPLLDTTICQTACCSHGCYYSAPPGLPGQYYCN